VDRSWLFLALLLAVTACNTDPARGKARASVDQPAAAASAAPSSDTELGYSKRGGIPFRFNEESSSIEFVGAKVTRRHAGKFGSFRGTLQVLERDPTKSSVSVTIDMATLTSDDDALTRHLKSPDFFDVGRFPKATFSSTSIVAGGQDGATHTITGNLVLHGVTRQVTFPAQIKALSEAVEATAEFAISRKEFGIAYSGVAGNLIKDQVLLMIKLHAAR
jgi:polyisoprenoid-binding protein YceI